MDLLMVKHLILMLIKLSVPMLLMDPDKSKHLHKETQVDKIKGHSHNNRTGNHPNKMVHQTNLPNRIVHNSHHNKMVNHHKVNHPNNHLKVNQHKDNLKANQLRDNLKANHLSNLLKANQLRVNQPKVNHPKDNLKANHPNNHLKANQPKVNQLRVNHPKDNLKVNHPNNHLKANQPKDNPKANHPKVNLKVNHPSNHLKANLTRDNLKANHLKLKQLNLHKNKDQLLSKIKSNPTNQIKTKELMVNNLTMVKAHLLNKLDNSNLHGTNGLNPNGKQVPISMALNQNQTMTSATEKV
jgi:hypothetical protein